MNRTAIASVSLVVVVLLVLLWLSRDRLMPGPSGPAPATSSAPPSTATASTPSLFTARAIGNPPRGEERPQIAHVAISDLDRDGLSDVLNCHCRTLKGKVLIDVSNPFNADYSDFVTPWDTSAAEELQRQFPQARVVGAYKNVFWEVFDHPQFGETLSDVLVTGDDAAAKAAFLALAAGTPFRYLDAGALINSRTVERLTFITSSLGRELQSYPRMNWRLLTQDLAAAA